MRREGRELLGTKARIAGYVRDNLYVNAARRG
jgi:hypothetical protein